MRNAGARGVERPREVVFALLPNVVLLDVAGPADAFRNAGGKVPGSYRLRFVAPQPRVQAAVGLQLGELEPLLTLLRRFATEAAREEARLFCDGLVADSAEVKDCSVAA